MHTWSAQDSASAIKEGWEIFTTDHDPGYEARAMWPNNKPYGHRPFELQAVEEAKLFMGDDKAWQHVCKQAAAGSALHLRALLFLGQESPNELTAICEMWRSFLPAGGTHGQPAQ